MHAEHTQDAANALTGHFTNRNQLGSQTIQEDIQRRTDFSLLVLARLSVSAARSRPDRSTTAYMMTSTVATARASKKEMVTETPCWGQSEQSAEEELAA